jgi:SAM-dependent methyltransferase
MAGWWLDERAHAGAEHLDPAYVAGYETKSGFDPSEDVAVLLGLGLDRDSTVVDLGAGTGVFALAVAPQCRDVIAVDVSPAMLAVLRERAVAVPNLRVVEAGFLSYVHDGPPAHVVYTRNALHQLPDFWKVLALDRIASMLRPGGILRLRDLVFDFEPAEAHERLEAWLAGAVDDPRAGFTAAELAEHVRTEFSTFRWLFEPMLDRAGFTILDVAYRRAAYATYTCRLRGRR